MKHFKIGRPATAQATLAAFDRTRSLHPSMSADTVSRITGDRPKILFLDDEERILNALGALFRYKYQVFTATNGEQALAILRRCQVHVVVSDQRMPGMTGVEFLRQAKAVSPNTVRILLTGFSDLSAVIDSVNDGEVYRFLNKPWGNQEIQAVIADALTIGLALHAGSSMTKAAPAASPTESPTASPNERPTVLMLHDKRETFEAIRPLLNDANAFVHARTLDECLEALNTQSVGVVVSDLQVGSRDTSELLKVLKQEHPQILTIVLAESAEANHVIDLINQAKIFRYVLSPYKPQKIKFFIDSALTQFQRHTSRPVLVRTQKVDAPRGLPARSASLIAERLRSLRTLFGARAATR